MIEKNEVLLKINDEWKHFSHPHNIIIATNVDDVLKAFKEVESLVKKNNWYAAGFVSYEAAPAFDKALRVIDSNGFPLLWFGLYSEPFTLKHSDVFKNLGSFNETAWKPSVDRENYTAAIEEIKKQIACGNTYQVNFTMRLNSHFNAQTWGLFLNLAQNQNNYAAYVNAGRFVICSASPELFFKLDGDKIYCRPMKGTVGRGRTTQEDKEQADWLKESQKNRAENVMIVDMVRNDLGRIAKIGTVRVPELFKTEKYPTLFQLTSTVQANTQASIADIFTALFPSASITGAPKVSTMKIIAELESTPRKIYTGSIGYFSYERKAQFNVAIRTVLVDQEKETAEYGIGGGIVWDSVSSDEHNEALLKSKVLTEPPIEFSLLETLIWNPQDGYFLLEKHIERITDSAEYFNRPFSRMKFVDLLEEMQKKFTSPKRIRILLNQNGKMTSEVNDLSQKDIVFKARVAGTAIDSSNPFYFHKTTHRDIYPRLGEYDDLLLYNEREELTEFTIGNLVAELNGKLYTPPISCGLLAGTFRAHLLESGEIEERILRKSELKDFSKIFLINSVRKWVAVKI